MMDKEQVREAVRVNYANVATKQQEGCCAPTCCAGEVGVASVGDSTALGYAKADLDEVPQEADLALGCGNPVALASLREGEVVLDLGSGGGLDCFLAANAVGEQGQVIGVDMTPEMVQLARRNAARQGVEQVEFRLGEIEHLPVADESVDVILSNCVVNLSVQKGQVFKEAWRVLKPGGRLSISDIVLTSHQIPQEVREDAQALVGCVGNAAHVDELASLLEETGFEGAKVQVQEASRAWINDVFPGKFYGQYAASATIEATKKRS